MNSCVTNFVHKLKQLMLHCCHISCYIFTNNPLIKKTQTKTFDKMVVKHRHNVQVNFCSFIFVFCLIVCPLLCYTGSQLSLHRIVNCHFHSTTNICTHIFLSLVFSSTTCTLAINRLWTLVWLLSLPSPISLLLSLKLVARASYL